MSPEIIAAFGTAIVAPILAYLKIREERLKTGEKRDTQTALMEKRLADCEKKMNGIDELKDAIAKINNSLTKIETILEMYIKKMDRE